MTAPGHHDERLQASLLRPLSRLRERLRFYLVVAGVARLGIVIVAAALGQLLLDRWLSLSVDQRIVLNILITLLWLVLAFRWLIKPLTEPLDDLRLAYLIDRHFPALQDRATAAVHYLTNWGHRPVHGSPALINALLRDVVEPLRQVDVLKVLNPRRLRNAAALFIGLFLLSVAAFQLFPGLMHTWFARNWLLADIAWPQHTYIYADLNVDRTIYHPRGESLTITARFEGRPPNNALLHWRSSAGTHDALNMTRVGNERLTASLGRISEDLRLHITGGDAETPPFRVQVVDRPRVVATAAEITPPDYTNLPPARIEQETTLELLAGSALTLTARLNKPVARGTLVAATGAALPAEFVSPEELRVRWPTPVSGTYYFALEDERGLENVRPVRLAIKVNADRPPEIELTVRAVREFITPRALLDLIAVVRDTYGLTAATLYAQRQEDPPLLIRSLTPDTPRRAAELTSRLAVTRLNVEPGQRVRVWAEAVDNQPGGENRARSAVFELRVLSPAAYRDEITRRELELRQELEDILSEQRGLRDGVTRLSPPALESPSGQQQAAGLSRRQGWLQNRVQRVAAGFRQLLAEMQANRVARLADEERLGARVAAPLETVAENGMPIATELLDLLRENPTAAALNASLEQQEQLILTLEQVLANVRQWEGYEEAIAALEALIAEQEAVRDQTTDTLAEELEAILGPLTPAENAPETPPDR